MKRFESALRALMIFTLGFILQPSSAAEGRDPLAYMDSVEFSLLTCSPHEEVYSLYGHTALRYHDKRKGRGDFTFNWGVFNFQTPHFVLRFVFGLTDYELGLGSFRPFCNYYRHWGSAVTEQVLNLTREEKQRLSLALGENYQPENRIYRYNYFYDNCSTRPRDMIERCIDGEIVYDERHDYRPSFREMIHEKTGHHPWATFGNDMLLGVKADMKTTRREQEFLPDHLLYDFDHAQIRGADGSWRPLVKERRQPVRPGIQIVEEEFPLRPMTCALLLLAVSMAIAIVEWRRHHNYIYWDAVLMTAAGVVGCVLTVMIFSQHPTTSINLQLLLFNPLHLYYLPAVLRRCPSARHYWRVALPLMAVLFFLGSLVQHYAEGMTILALCLLIRSLIHIRNDK